MLLLALLHPIVSFNLWTWSIHPSTVIGIAALAALYVWAARKHHKSPTTGQKFFFFAGARHVRRRFGRVGEISNAGVAIHGFCPLVDEINESKNRDPDHVDEVPVERRDIDEQ